MGKRMKEIQPPEVTFVNVTPYKIKKLKKKTSYQIAKAEIQRVWHMPQPEAAKQLGISVSTLKRRFYKLYPKIRWPYKQYPTTTEQQHIQQQQQQQQIQNKKQKQEKQHIQQQQQHIQQNEQQIQMERTIRYQPYITGTQPQMYMQQQQQQQQQHIQQMQQIQQQINHHHQQQQQQPITTIQEMTTQQNIPQMTPQISQMTAQPNIPQMPQQQRIQHNNNNKETYKKSIKNNRIEGEDNKKRKELNRKSQHQTSSSLRNKHHKTYGLPTQPYIPENKIPKEGDMILILCTDTKKKVLHISSTWQLKKELITEIIITALRAGQNIKEIKYNGGYIKRTKKCQKNPNTIFERDTVNYCVSVRVTTCNCHKQGNSEPIGAYVNEEQIKNHLNTTIREAKDGYKPHTLQMVAILQGAIVNIQKVKSSS